MRAFHSHLTALIIVAGLMTVPAAARESAESKKIHAAEETLKASVTAPDKGIPKEMLEHAECVGVFPGVKKGAFVVGGKFGRGVFTCRQKDGTMGAPAFFSIGGGSVGWQFGGQEVDLVLLVMNEGGMKHLLQDHFTLGGEASAAAGPVGRTTQASTDAQMHAEIVSWSRSRGLFLGASLEGAVITQNKKMTEKLYGKPVTAQEILMGPGMPVPATAKSFVTATTDYTRRSS
jgi:SH3 domain-containing YSC84-like protein 1